MKRSRLFAVLALATSFAWLLAGGCSSGGDGANRDGGFSGSGGSKDNLPDSMVIKPDAAGPEGGAGSNLHPLCGSGVCLPDFAQSCIDYQPPNEGGAGQGGASGGGEGGDGGQSGAAAGQGGTPHNAGGEGGASGAGESVGGVAAGGAPTVGAGGNGGEAGQAEPVGPSLYSCQVARQNNLPITQCERAGAGGKDAPCFSSADCAAGLACVTEGDAGRCLAYCCSLEGECGAGTYCAERQLRTTGSNAEPTPVPVCVPADGCNLDEQRPCPDDNAECRCKGETSCMVVRDGTTTCLKPGTGQQGDACPCAWNHLCSSVTKQCVKICHTDPAKSECGSQKCQASAELPPNFGVCVGPLK